MDACQGDGRFHVKTPTIVALLSTYREGPLARQAVASALRAADHVVAFEGPAGEPLPNEEECPGTDLGIPDESGNLWMASVGLQYKAGRWTTDAAKRTAIVAHVRKLKLPPPVWGVWIDGDEILVNGEYLRDWLQLITWEDDPAEPFMGWPIKLVELDGTVVVCQAKVVRLDLLDRYSVSSSVFRNSLGAMETRGNQPFNMDEWMAPRARLIEQEARLYQLPPLSCEPHLLHRSFLRHPARRGLRLHEQEAQEIERAKQEQERLSESSGEPSASASS